MRFRNRPAWLQQGRRIVKWFSAPLVSVYESDEQTGAANMRLELFQDLEILRNELRFEEKVLRRITRNGELRRDDQFCSRAGQPLIGARYLFKIAAQISDGGIDLSEPDLHVRKINAHTPAAIAFYLVESITERCL